MKKLGYIICFILCFVLNIYVVNAEIVNDIYDVDYSKSNVKVFDRTESNKWGVNKHWNITSSNLKNVKSTPFVDSSKKIYDFAGILTDEEEKEIYKYIEDFIEKTKFDMVFVSIDMPYSYDSKNEDYAADFYDYNDFGIDFSNYSGILLLRNNYSADKYYDMYTFGDAQLYFDQTRYDNILDEIYGDIHGGYYSDGIISFISKCFKYYDSGVASEYKHAYIDDMGYIQFNYHIPYIPCFIGSSIMTLIVMLVMIGKNKMVRKATTANAYLAKDSINYTEHLDQFVSSHTTHYTVSSSSGGGGSHGGSSGGGHSSGGGRHG